MNNFYEALIFTTEGKHTKYYDCYICCNNKTYMANKNLLCKIDYFYIYFDSKLMKLKNGKPICEFDTIYDLHINTFLTIIYTGNYIPSDDVSGSLQFYDYIGYTDIINEIIWNFKSYDIDTMISILQYMQEKEDILVNIDYKGIYLMYVNVCLENNRWDLLDNIDDDFIDMNEKNIQYMMKNIPCTFIQLVEYMYKREGQLALEYIDMKCLVGEEHIFTGELESYIKNMDNTSPVKNYLIVLQMKIINNYFGGDDTYLHDGNKKYIKATMGLFGKLCNL